MKKLQILFDLRYHLLTLGSVIVLFLIPIVSTISPQSLEVFPIVVDTVTTHFHRYPSEHVYRADMQIEYIGNANENILLSGQNNLANYNQDFYAMKYRLYKRNDLAIYVDTQTAIGSDSKPLKAHPDYTFIKGELKKNYRYGYLSHPVIIKNIGQDTVSLNASFHLPAVLEALNESREWKPIQRYYSYQCATGLPYPYLPKGEFLVASLPILYGDYPTKLRVRYGFNNFIYSNTFEGNIYKKMFEAWDNTMK